MSAAWFLESWLMRFMLSAGAAVIAVGCGGGGGGGGANPGNERDSGPQQTTLSVAASDADGDSLSYRWRVTAGTVDNRNAATTVWTLPPGPGVHFAYVMVADGKGGYAQQQYAVSSDPLDDPAPLRRQAPHSPPAVNDVSGSTMRLRFHASDATDFAASSGAAAQRRLVYLPDLPVQVVHAASSAIVFSGRTDVGGEVDLPKLAAGDRYQILCAHAADSALQSCGALIPGATADVRDIPSDFSAALNLRLYGHVGFDDGGICGTHSEYFQQFESATVQLLQADGSAVTPARRVNRFGDYLIEAAVPVRSNLRLRVACGGYSAVLDVPASSAAAGYTAAAPIELSHRIANSRPVVRRMVANGPEGSVRGRMITDETVGASNILPGEDQFLTYKGLDTRLSACRYYRSFGMVRDCDAQGNMIEPVTMDEWKREQQLPPYEVGGSRTSADYINARDLNLVRRMAAAAKARDHIAFLVCNHPGPEGSSQREVDEVLSTALAGDALVACVGMEWSVTPGANDNKPFTKFVTFSPDGSLLASINLDGRGEKYVPGSCVACHGGTTYNGRFPETGNPSPFLGSRFLPFDTANFRFGSAKALTESVQADELRRLNELVSATESLDDAESTPTRRLVQGWYAAGTNTLNRDYVPPAWQAADRATPGAARFYREVIGTSCRTCHTALGRRFDWDSTVLTPARAQTHVCGGTASLALNASMPNALITRARLVNEVHADPTLAELMRTFLGCTDSRPDPVYPAR